MPKARRIERQQDCPFGRGAQVEFQFEGRPIEGFEREPLAVSLLAAGVQVFGRSLKYHRPRGPICLHAHCSGCLMRVDGIPNTRTCDTPCRSGLVVERQSGWPGSRHDLFRILDWIYGQRLDHHGMFTGSGLINRVAMRAVRRLSGFGQLPTADPPRDHPLQRLAAEVVVIGAGVAGLQASLALAEAGLPVVLLEHGDKIGGRLLDRACQVQPDSQPASDGWQTRKKLKARFEQQTDIELHQRTATLAVFPGPDRLQVVASNDCETLEISARRLVVACGGWDQIPLFENNDLPGVLTLRALDRLVFGWGVVPAEPVLVAGASPEALRLTAALQTAGVVLAGLVGARADQPGVATLGRLGVALYPEHRVIRARGGRWLDRVELAPDPDNHSDRVLDCGLLAIEAPEAPAYELAHHAGCRVEFRSRAGHSVVADEFGRTSDLRIFAAGHCTGARCVDEAWRQGLRAGLACALSLTEDEALKRRLDELIEPEQAGSRAEG